MAEPGKMNTLMVVKKVDIGVYLDGEDLGRILLPQRVVPPHAVVGSQVEVFVHYDQEGRLIATTRRPLALPGTFAYLKVVKLTSLGALLDWGLPHPLLAPTREQKQMMEEGKSYLVRVILEEEKNRIIASSRIDQFLDQSPVEYEAGQEVELLIGPHTDLGYKAIINDAHWGVLYENEVFQALKRGDRVPGYIKKVREDQKIDLCLQRPGYEKVEGLAGRILHQLQEHGGLLAVSDKSAPETIYRLFGVSKKSYKKAIGALYREKKIVIEGDGIRLQS